MARVFRSHTALKRPIEAVTGDSNCGTFCVGTISTMPKDVYEAIRLLGYLSTVSLVHFRTMSGTVSKFKETFIGNRDVDMLNAMRLFSEVGYDGPFVCDHVPEMSGDSERQE